MKRSIIITISLITSTGVLGILVYIYLFFSIGMEPILTNDSSTETVINHFGKSFNSQRIKLGIPIIEPHWVAHDPTIDGVIWMNEEHQLTTHEAHHFAKTIEFQGGELVSEKDSFNKFLKDSIDMRVTYIFNFSSKQWSCKLSKHQYKSYPPGKATEISVFQADSILTSWGIPRSKIGI